MEILIASFVIGLIGSFHCAGMCGPIALSIPINGNTVFHRIVSALIYNIGRVLMYGVLGLIFGFLGKGFEFIGIQQWISLAMGSIMILSVVFPFVLRKFNFSFANSFNSLVSNTLQKLFMIRSNWSLFFLGTINALLPCGLVYLAIANSITTATPILGMLSMVFFGLATIPIMVTISVIGNSMSSALRIGMQKLIPWLVVIVGILFVLRGLALGIPFISPPKEKMHVSKHVTKTCGEKTQGVTKSCCHGKK